MRSFLPFFLLPLRLVAEVLALYLSWYDDPTTTMTIQWHTLTKEKATRCRLYLPDGKKIDHEADFLSLEDRLIYRITLKELLPDTDYRFQIDDDPALYLFRTAPLVLEKPLKFLVGGDLYQSKEIFRKITPSLIDQDPLFAVLGGDIAYAIHPDPFTDFTGFFQTPAKRWFNFLRDWKERMIAPDGRIIPFLLLPGNHDISSKAPDLFFKLFDFPEKKLYREISFGNYLSLLLLDTGHLSPIKGEQTLFLQNSLKQNRDKPYLIPVYHIAAYPSYYAFQAETPKTLRKWWCPLFDEANLPIAFENHNHSWKKTFPIRGEKIDPSGTIYLGDGCWGAIPRTTRKDWYLDKAGAFNHVYLVELEAEKATIQALTFSAESLDRFTIQPRH